MKPLVSPLDVVQNVDIEAARRGSKNVGPTWSRWARHFSGGTCSRADTEEKSPNAVDLCLQSPGTPKSRENKEELDFDTGHRINHFEKAFNLETLIISLFPGGDIERLTECRKVQCRTFSLSCFAEGTRQLEGRTASSATQILKSV